MLELQHYLLNERGFGFVLGSRFSQDCVENLFSAVRSIQKKPPARAFKNILKLIAVSQFLHNPTDLILQLSNTLLKWKGSSEFRYVKNFTSNFQHENINYRYVFYDIIYGMF